MEDLRKRIKKVTAVALVFALSVLSTVGCSSNTSSTTANSATDATKIVYGGDFSTYSLTEVSNFDPFVTVTADARALFFNIYEGLIKVTSDGDFVGAIADKWVISSDAKTYTFTLKDGVKFQDESIVTTDDVLYSIQKAIDSSFSGYSEIDKFSATDSKTISITLKNANANYISQLTGPIVKKDYADNGTKPIGTGPFKLKSYTAQKSVVLEKFKDYWNVGFPYLNTVTLKFSADTSAPLLELQAGTVDCGPVTTESKATLDSSKYDFIQKNSNAVQLLGLNNTFEPFKNVKVRQALNYLVNADEIKSLVNEYGVNNGGGLIPGLTKYYNSDVETAYPTNVTKAKELLKAAGYESGFSFTIKVPSVYQVHVDTAEVIKEQLAKAGITVNIQSVDWADWLANVYKGRQYEATIISLDGSTAAPESFLSRYVSTSSSNFINFNSTNYDQVYKTASTTLDPNERITAFKNAQKILSDEAASVFIQDIGSLVALNNKYSGYTTYPLYVTDFSTLHLVK